MIKVENRKLHYGLSWEEYLLLAGRSNSSFKSIDQEKMNASVKVQRGKMVDKILSGESVDISSELYPEAQSIAMEINKSFGNIIQYSKTQVAVTADFVIEHNGTRWVLPFKGLMDCFIAGSAVIDYKVTGEKSIAGVASYLNYDTQLTGYSLAAGVGSMFIIAYCVPTKHCAIYSLKPNYDQWVNRIIDYGVQTKITN